MKVGDQVEVWRKKRVVFAGRLESFDDDSDTVQVNVEEFARIRAANGDMLVFRRGATGWDRSTEHGWIAKSKTKAREWGAVRIKAMPESERA